MKLRQPLRPVAAVSHSVRHLRPSVDVHSPAWPSGLLAHRERDDSRYVRLLKCQPVFETNLPPMFWTWVAQISVRQRIVCEYGSQAVNHLRPLTVW